MEPKRHNLKTINDILAVVTPENFENFMTDFREMIKYSIEQKEKVIQEFLAKPETQQVIVAGIFTEEFLRENIDLEAITFEWIDDGKNEWIDPPVVNGVEQELPTDKQQPPVAGAEADV